MIMFTEFTRPYAGGYICEEPPTTEAAVYLFSTKSFACHTRENVWSAASPCFSSPSSDGFFFPSLLPNWHQFTPICKSRFMSNQSCHLGSRVTGIAFACCVELRNHRLTCQRCVWWPSFSHHLVVCMLILKWSYPERTSPSSLSSHLFDIEGSHWKWWQRRFYHVLMKYEVPVKVGYSLSSPATLNNVPTQQEQTHGWSRWL